MIYLRDYNVDSDLIQNKRQDFSFVQGDKGATIKVNLYENSNLIDLTGCTIEAKYKRADNKIIKRTINDTTENSFIATLDDEITAVIGTLKIIFTIKKSDVEISTFMLFADIKEGIDINSLETGGTANITITIFDSETQTEKEVIMSGNEDDLTVEEVAN